MDYTEVNARLDTTDMARIIPAMKLHIITVGQPKLTYARLGWEEYCRRLGRYHQLRLTHLADKYANQPKQFEAAIGNAFMVALEIGGKNLSSHELSEFLHKQAVSSREVCFIIGGPDGIPSEVSAAADLQWSLSALTLPHDLAMVVLAEALYRASSIQAGHPYHRA